MSTSTCRPTTACPITSFWHSCLCAPKHKPDGAEQSTDKCNEEAGFCMHLYRPLVFLPITSFVSEEVEEGSSSAVDVMAPVLKRVAEQLVLLIELAVTANGISVYTVSANSASHCRSYSPDKTVSYMSCAEQLIALLSNKRPYDDKDLDDYVDKKVKQRPDIYPDLFTSLADYIEGSLQDISQSAPSPAPSSPSGASPASSSSSGDSPAASALSRVVGLWGSTRGAQRLAFAVEQCTTIATGYRPMVTSLKSASTTSSSSSSSSTSASSCVKEGDNDIGHNSDEYELEPIEGIACIPGLLLPQPVLTQSRFVAFSSTLPPPLSSSHQQPVPEPSTSASASSPLFSHSPFSRSFSSFIVAASTYMPSIPPTGDANCAQYFIVHVPDPDDDHDTPAHVKDNNIDEVKQHKATKPRLHRPLLPYIFSLSSPFTPPVASSFCPIAQAVSALLRASACVALVGRMHRALTASPSLSTSTTLATDMSSLASVVCLPSYEHCLALVQVSTAALDILNRQGGSSHDPSSTATSHAASSSTRPFSSHLSAWNQLKLPRIILLLQSITSIAACVEALHREVHRPYQYQGSHPRSQHPNPAQHQQQQHLLHASEQLLVHVIEAMLAFVCVAKDTVPSHYTPNHLGDNSPITFAVPPSSLLTPTLHSAFTLLPSPSSSRAHIPSMVRLWAAIGLAIRLRRARDAIAQAVGSASSRPSPPPPPPPSSPRASSAASPDAFPHHTLSSRDHCGHVVDSLLAAVLIVKLVSMMPGRVALAQLAHERGKRNQQGQSSDMSPSSSASTSPSLLASSSCSALFTAEALDHLLNHSLPASDIDTSSRLLPLLRESFRWCQHNIYTASAKMADATTMSTTSAVTPTNSAETTLSQLPLRCAREARVRSFAPLRVLDISSEYFLYGLSKPVFTDATKKLSLPTSLSSTSSSLSTVKTLPLTAFITGPASTTSTFPTSHPHSTSRPRADSGADNGTVEPPLAAELFPECGAGLFMESSRSRDVDLDEIVNMMHKQSSLNTKVSLPLSPPSLSIRMPHQLPIDRFHVAMAGNVAYAHGAAAVAVAGSAHRLLVSKSDGGNDGKKLASCRPFSLFNVNDIDFVVELDAALLSSPETMMEMVYAMREATATGLHPFSLELAALVAAETKQQRDMKSGSSSAATSSSSFSDIKAALASWDRHIDVMFVPVGFLTCSLDEYTVPVPSSTLSGTTVDMSSATLCQGRRAGPASVVDAADAGSNPADACDSSTGRIGTTPASTIPVDYRKLRRDIRALYIPEVIARRYHTRLASPAHPQTPPPSSSPLLTPASPSPGRERTPLSPCPTLTDNARCGTQLLCIRMSEVSDMLQVAPSVLFPSASSFTANQSQLSQLSQASIDRIRDRLVAWGASLEATCRKLLRDYCGAFEACAVAAQSGARCGDEGEWGERRAVNDALDDESDGKEQDKMKHYVGDRDKDDDVKGHQMADAYIQAGFQLSVSSNFSSAHPFLLFKNQSPSSPTSTCALANSIARLVSSSKMAQLLEGEELLALVHEATKLTRELEVIAFAEQ